MNVVTSIIATAAVTAAAIRGVRALRRRAAAAARQKVNQDRTATNDETIVDLERDTATGVYGLADRR